LYVSLVIFPLFEQAAHGCREQIDMCAAVTLLVFYRREDSCHVLLSCALRCPHWAKNDPLESRFTTEKLVDAASNLTREPIQDRTGWRTHKHLDREALRDELAYDGVDFSDESLNAAA